MINVPMTDLEGLLKAIENFFGPDIFAPMTDTTEPKTLALNQHGIALKYFVDKRRNAEAAAKQIFDVIEKLKEPGDSDNFQEFLDDEVHNLASEEGSNVNNDGPQEQLRFLIEEGDEKEVRRMLGCVFEENEKLFERIIDPYGQES